ncbi:T9SS type A sorting domain-containing protein [Flavobacterium sp. N1719]|uniref:T9SS type A sorting domain-containing protein n=1 Tax=Flavobacterium sp. N1719 TaxID=2885633 RepID=UPI002221633B|nr:T9SS type A sorting domain-containing protein [Flavobacterium sp. N1719]
MERKDFIRKSFGVLSAAIVVPSILKAGNSENEESTTTCSVTSSETAGPFPTLTPDSLIRTNIVGDRTGIPFDITISIMNINANCAALEGAIVDIWHCDKDGYYSQYGGTAMQTVNYTTNTFLRGRQTTNANGQVAFTSIFPGWYTSRATHIHVHIYNAAGTSLLVTQIAFPEGTNSAVVQANSATAYGYTKGMTGYTYNASDNVFSDSVTSEMSTITGSVSSGFALTHTIYVAGPVLESEEFNSNSFFLGQNYPNPSATSTKIPIVLNEDSQVETTLFTLTGQRILTPIQSNLSAGIHEIELDVSSLAKGMYIYKVVVENTSGRLEQSKKLIKD